MKFIPVIVLLMLSSCNVDESCNDQIEKTFIEFKETLSKNTNPAKYFSHEYLSNQIDGLFLVEDDKSLLHNTKAMIIWLSNYKLKNGTTKIVSCNKSIGVLSYNPTEYEKNGRYEFKYVFESNKWLINSVHKDYTKVIAK